MSSRCKKPLEESPSLFGGLEELTRKRLSGGRLCVTLDGGRFECFLQQQGGRHLFVLLSGARDPARMKLPLFDRWSWAESFPGHVINISDPTLYLAEDELRIGWYVGTASTDWTAALARLIKTLAKALDVPLSRTVVYGSSAGGFASLMVATRLEGIISVAINPQTEILRYSKRHVATFLSRAYGKQREELTEGDLGRLSVVRNSGRLRSARVLLVQNELDVHHFEKHYTPLCQRLGVTHADLAGVGSFRSMIYSSDTGHGPEPRAMVPLILEVALKNAGAEE